LDEILVAGGGYEDNNQLARLCLFNHLAAVLAVVRPWFSVFCSQNVLTFVRIFCPNKCWFSPNDLLADMPGAVNDQRFEAAS
jgi:hypothetical protein